jgi:hypothetical protein
VFTNKSLTVNKTSPEKAAAYPNETIMTLPCIEKKAVLGKTHLAQDEMLGMTLCR